MGQGVRSSSARQRTQVDARASVDGLFQPQFERPGSVDEARRVDWRWWRVSRDTLCELVGGSASSSHHNADGRSPLPGQRPLRHTPRVVSLRPTALPSCDLAFGLADGVGERFSWTSTRSNTSGPSTRHGPVEVPKRRARAWVPRRVFIDADASGLPVHGWSASSTTSCSLSISARGTSASRGPLATISMSGRPPSAGTAGRCDWIRSAFASRWCARPSNPVPRNALGPDVA
jgi:hypothetical protein